MSIRVVLDTNVFISGMFWGEGKPHEILRKCYKREINLFISRDIIEEVEGILTREKKFELTQDEIIEHLKLIMANSILVKPRQKIEVVREDPADNRVLECAVEAEADYIVSGDKHLLKLKRYKNLKIVNASEFLEALNKS